MFQLALSRTAQTQGVLILVLENSTSTCFVLMTVVLHGQLRGLSKDGVWVGCVCVCGGGGGGVGRRLLAEADLSVRGCGRSVPAVVA